MSQRIRPIELPIPPAAARARDGVEVLRAWYNARGLHCSVRLGVWGEHFGVAEPVGWATQLSDLIREVAPRRPGNPDAFIWLAKEATRALLTRTIDSPPRRRPRVPQAPGEASRRKLPIPRAVAGDRNAYELLRVWYADGGRHGNLQFRGRCLGGDPRLPGTFASLMAEVAGQVAEALHAHSGEEVKGILRTMRETIESELSGAFDERIPAYELPGPARAR